MKKEGKVLKKVFQKSEWAFIFTKKNQDADKDKSHIERERERERERYAIREETEGKQPINRRIYNASMTKDGMTRKMERRKKKTRLKPKDRFPCTYVLPLASKLLRNHVSYPIPVLGNKN
jgi:hypothetical protein